MWLIFTILTLSVSTKEAPMSKVANSKNLEPKKATEQPFTMSQLENGPYSSSFPQLQSLGTPEIRSKINQRIRTLFWPDDLKASDCADSDGTLGNVTRQVSVTFSSARVISLREEYDFWCFGPYPDAGINLYTFDLKTGEELKLTDFAKGEKEIEQIKKIIRKSKRVTDECREGSASTMVAFSEKGLTLRPSFPRVSRGCDVDIEIPASELQKYLKEEFLLPHKTTK